MQKEIKIHANTFVRYTFLREVLSGKKEFFSYFKSPPTLTGALNRNIRTRIASFGLGIPSFGTGCLVNYIFISFI